MGNLVGNITLGAHLRYSDAALGTASWSLDVDHSKTLVPGSGAGKVNQGCIYSLTVGSSDVTVDLKTLPSESLESNRAVQTNGGPNISGIAGLVIRNKSATATVTVTKPMAAGFVGLTCKLPPLAAVAIDYAVGFDMGSASNLTFVSNVPGAVVEITAFGS